MVRRAPGLLVALLAVAAGCSKSKPQDTTPAASGAGAEATPTDTTRPADPAPQAAADGDVTGAVGDQVANVGGDGVPEPPAAIEPPTLDKPPEDIRAAVNLALSEGLDAMKAGRPDDAIVAAQRALREDEVNVDAMVLLAWAYYEKAYYDKSEAILDLALARPDGPSNPRLHFIRGLVYEKTDRETDASSAYARAVQADGDYRNGLLNLGGKHLENKRYREAVQVFEQMVGALGDERAEVWTNLGSGYRGLSVEPSEIARRADLLKRAEVAYMKAVTTNASYEPVHYNLGLLYLDADPFPGPSGGDMDTIERLERARSHFRQYRSLPGANAKLVDEVDQLTQKLIEREQTRREKLEKLEKIRREREEAAAAAGGDEEAAAAAGGDEGEGN